MTLPTMLGFSPPLLFFPSLHHHCKLSDDFVRGSTHNMWTNLFQTIVPSPNLLPSVDHRFGCPVICHCKNS
ncbi:Hypothetical predicted protein [Cloeon dipterum]|uniref:Uncharacterized protein n=1 Tax=Cloeon dipterum TaxID=197152 RepID=A0A8S1CRR7_9INSE|nr:Hypothetical predicted protein [Cloeon dipterum]